ncbi:hypothetical protein AVEN_185043-2-1, partial [Araneus ventricosus]
GPPPESGASLLVPSVYTSSLLGNATSQGIFSGAGINGSRWEQDLDYKRDGQTTPSRIVAAVVVCASPYEGECGRGATQ